METDETPAGSRPRIFETRIIGLAGISWGARPAIHKSRLKRNTSQKRSQVMVPQWHRDGTNLRRVVASVMEEMLNIALAALDKTRVKAPSPVSNPIHMKNKPAAKNPTKVKLTTSERWCDQSGRYPKGVVKK